MKGFTGRKIRLRAGVLLTFIVVAQAELYLHYALPFLYDSNSYYCKTAPTHHFILPTRRDLAQARHGIIGQQLLVATKYFGQALAATRLLAVCS